MLFEMATKKGRLIPHIEMAKLLRDAGYAVTRRTDTVKKTFTVAKDCLEQFIHTRTLLGYSAKDAVDEAFALWVESKRTEVEEKITKQGRTNGGSKQG